MNKTRHLILLILLTVCWQVKAQPEDLDSVEISLLTCSPHNEVYSLYGHTAIRVEDKRHGGGDIAVNYGMFSFDKPFFLLRFIFGLTDYEMGIERFDWFCNYYRHCGSSVTQQTINLSREEKLNILAALEQNYRPENRVYRYNYFYDNCTTRAIDMILKHMNCTKGVGESDKYPSFRTIIRELTRDYPWATFGNDILLGVKADLPIDKREWLFLPAHAMQDFAHTKTVGEATLPLVKATTVVVQPGNQAEMKGFPLRPRTVFMLLLIVTVLVTLVEHFTKKTLWGYDALLMVLCGLSGIVLFLMLFSQHPTVRFNLQLLLLNPLPLFFVWRMVRRVRKNLYDWQYALWIMLLCLFFVGSIWQNYAEGTMLLASSLLIRNVWCMLRLHKTLNHIE